MRAAVHINAPSGHPLPRDLIERAVRIALEEEGVSDGDVSVTFLEDAPIHDLNRRWLGHGWVPDVLSFRLHDRGEPPVADVYVGLEQAERQARDVGVPLDEELCRLAIHGVLHALGHDHAARAEPSGSGEGMFERQETLLQMALGRAP